MIAIVRHYHLETPAEWETALRAFSPIRQDLPWLSLRWFPMQRAGEDGVIRDCGRWVLHECIPEAVQLSVDPRCDIFEMLRKERPSEIRDPNHRRIRRMFVSDYQWEMYRAHRVWAREFWILQGPNGGHPVTYSDYEQKQLQVLGLPTDPPAVGDLSYAPFDARVTHAVQQRNRLVTLGSLTALRKSAAPQQLKAQQESIDQQFRAWLWERQEQASEAAADFLAYYASSAKTATECRNTIPAMSARDVNRAAVAKDLYIETGTLPA